MMPWCINSQALKISATRRIDIVKMHIRRTGGGFKPSDGYKQAGLSVLNQARHHSINLVSRSGSIIFHGWIGQVENPFYEHFDEWTSAGSMMWDATTQSREDLGHFTE